jgi:hypothetical protein
MAVTTDLFETRWQTRRYIGDRKPYCRVSVRRGELRHGYIETPYGLRALANGRPPIAGGAVDEAPPPEILFGGGGAPRANPMQPVGQPWGGTWVPGGSASDTGWHQIPNVAEVRIEQSFQQNGLSVATVVIDNVGFDGYHIQRGYLSPYRGFTPTNRPPSIDQYGELVSPNDWYDVGLVTGCQVLIEQSYGDDPNMPVAFVGLIDDIDFDSHPDKMTLTARDMGQTLTDQRLYGIVKDPKIGDPVVFVNQPEPTNLRWRGLPYPAVGVEQPAPLGPVAGTDGRIYIQDVSDVVRQVLMWAGFTSWEVQDTGTNLGTDESGEAKHVFNHATFLIDIIRWACEQTGFMFFLKDPPDDESWGIPVFRASGALDDEPRRDGRFYDTPEATSDDRRNLILRDADTLTGIQAKFTTEPLASIIFVRGAQSSKGVVMPGAAIAGDDTPRLLAAYEPPWAGKNRLAGLYKHVTHTDNSLTSIEECDRATKLIAFAEAMQSAVCTVEIPGHPGIELDHQLGIMDTGTGINSRLWVSNRSSTFTFGQNADWRTTLGGSLIDTEDVVEIRELVRAGGDIGDSNYWPYPGTPGGPGYGAGGHASSEQPGQLARFVVDGETGSAWRSDNATDRNQLEWVEITLPRGLWGAVRLHAEFPGMEAFIGIWAVPNSVNGIDVRQGTEFPYWDEGPFEEGWLHWPASDHYGAYPPPPSEHVSDGVAYAPEANANGGWPIVQYVPRTSARFVGDIKAARWYRIPAYGNLGDGSKLRVGFRRLYQVGNHVHAGVVELRVHAVAPPAPHVGGSYG